MKNFRLFIPVALFLLIFSNYSCDKIKGKLNELPEILKVNVDREIKDSVEVKAIAAGTYTKEKTLTNEVKNYLDTTKLIKKENIDSIVLKKLVASIPATSSLDFSDIESATLQVNGVEWGSFPINASGKSIELTIAKKDIKNEIINNASFTFKYNAKIKKETPTTMLYVTLTAKVVYKPL